MAALTFSLMLPGSGGPAPVQDAGPVPVWSPAIAAAEAVPAPAEPAAPGPGHRDRQLAAPEPGHHDPGPGHRDPDPATPAAVPILLYHHLDPAADGSEGAIISVAEFAAQMAWLREHGFTAITVAELADWLDGTGELPPRPVLITFDDGYYSNYEYAYPLLRENGLRATLFVVSTTLGVDTAFAHVTYDDLLEMLEAGVFEPQVHSYDGHRLVDGQPVLLSWTAEELHADLDRFLAGFAEAGLPAPIAYAYPFGAYNDVTLQVLRDNGIRLGLTTKPGLVERGTDPLQLPRYVIFPGTTLCQFAAIMGLPDECPAEASAELAGSASGSEAGETEDLPDGVDRPELPPSPSRPEPSAPPAPPAKPRTRTPPPLPSSLLPSPF